MTRPRVLIVDDHPVVSQGLTTLLAADFVVVAVVADGQAMIDSAKALQPDIVVADVSLPDMTGIDALAQLRRDGVAVPVVFLTMHNQPGYARRALQAGAAGYVLKLAAPEELVLALRAALAGGTYVSPALAAKLLQGSNGKDTDEGHVIAALTAHQRDILRHFADGLSAKEIARKVGLSSRTVESHKYQIMESLGAQSTAELIRIAIRHGIVDP